MTVLLIVLAALFALSGLTKILDLGDARDRVEAVGVARSLTPVIGLAELAVVALSVAALFADDLALAAGLLGVAVMLGALSAHVRHGDGVDKMALGLVYLAVAVATVVGAA